MGADGGHHTIVVTGASGFIGRHLVPHLADVYQVRAVSRRNLEFTAPSASVVQINSIDGSLDWAPIVDGSDAVVHLAAIAHRSHPEMEHVRAVNVEGTYRLASCAARAGVRRFLLFSSVGVHGDATACHPLTEASPLRPHDLYSRSKLEAEEVVREICSGTEMEYCIIRPPLVYGRGAPGNYGRLIAWIRRGIPLPFAAINNLRSLVSVQNLASFVVQALQDAKAADEEFLICDGEDVSTAELVRKIAAALQMSPRLIRVPFPILKAASAVTGRSDDFRKLNGSLQIDAAKARNLLRWTPEVTLDEGIDLSVCDHDIEKTPPTARTYS